MLVTMVQGLLANLKTFEFSFTFLIKKKSTGTLKPIASKLQNKDQKHSMTHDTIKAFARVR